MISIRPYRRDDESACLAIYSANVGKQLIPPHYGKEFEETLKDPLVSMLVASVDGMVVGCGGINYIRTRDSAWLSFGLVHPAFQRRGIGSAMLLARLSLLDPFADRPCEVFLDATQNSKSFFMKYGFGWRETAYDQHGNVFETLRFPLTSQLVQQCKDALIRSGIDFVERPRVPIRT